MHRFFRLFGKINATFYSALFLLCCAFATNAQFRFDSWTTDDGLPQNSANRIVQTDDGYMWIPTLDGLVRFDGVRFKVFNKSNSDNLLTNRLENILVEDNETIWIITENTGLVRYQNNKFKTFTTDDGLPSNDILEMRKDADGSLLIFAVNGIVRTRDQGLSFQFERSQDYREYKVYFASSNSVWEISKNGLFLTRDGVQMNRFDLPFTPKPAEFDETFNFYTQVSFFEDTTGALWFSADGNLFKLQNGELTTLSAHNGLPPSRVRAIAQDGRGDVWVGTERDGACRLIANRFECFNTARGLSSNNITTIFLDREKTLWFGTDNGGIVRVTPQIIKPLSSAQGLLNLNVYPILEDRSGSFWIGSFGGLTRYAEGKVVNYTLRNGLIYDLVQALFEDRDGTLWVACVGGVQYLKDGKAVDFTEQLGLDIGEFDFWDVHQTADGAMWFATNRGLYKYENGATTHFTVRDGLPNDDVKAIHEQRDGSLWIATLGGAAHFYDNRFVAYTEKDGLAGDFVRSIYEDETGALWFGTYDSGLTLLRNGKFTKITVENGLFSNGVFAILPDARGNFWMSSNQGIYRVSRQHLIDFADGKISSVVSTAYDKSDGMLNTECNGGRQPAGIVARDGKLWFPTQNGVAIVDPEAIQFNPLPPPVVIENVKIDNQLLPDFKSVIVIEPGQNNLEIDYTGLSFIKPEQMRFRYKLEGLDDDWTEVGSRREAFYPYLPPGDYVFRVAAANSDSVWNETGAALAITVKPPFYRTWLFIGICLTATALIAFAVYRFRVSGLERAHRAQEEFSRRLINAHETERRRIAAELHDSIGQSLAMIKNRAVYGAASATDDAAKEHLELITAQTAQTISEVREISYNLRPYLLERLGLNKAVKSLLNKIGENHHLEIEADVDEVDNLFSAEAEMSIYRIIQECLNNIVKHAEANVAKVFIGKTERVLTIAIEDNGKGFDPHSAPKGDNSKGGFGMLGIAERARMLGGSYTIDSQPGGGTRVTIKINLTENVHITNNGNKH